MGADVDRAVRLSLDVLGAAVDADWEVRAGTLEWSCWETAEHLGNVMFAYAARFGLRTPPRERTVAFDYAARREGGPINLIYANRALGVAGLLETLESCTGFLTGVLSRADPDATSWHVFGASNPEGFASMALVETLVHTHDIASGLGLDYTAPADLCDVALRRLFPDVPTDTDRWPTLLWATGRGTLPGLPRRTTWQWHG